MTIKIKGHDIPKPNITHPVTRRAVAIEGHIYATLKRLGVDKDYAEVPMERIAIKKAPASVSFYFQGRNMKYSYGLLPRFADNLYIVDKIVEIMVDKFLDKEITIDQFSREFSEDDDLGDQLSKAREILGVDPSEVDFSVINKAYKKLARTHHPDMPNGSHEKFQEINAAHKLIEKELM